MKPFLNVVCGDHDVRMHLIRPPMSIRLREQFQATGEVDLNGMDQFQDIAAALKREMALAQARTKHCRSGVHSAREQISGRAIGLNQASGCPSGVNANNPGSIAGRLRCRECAR